MVCVSGPGIQRFNCSNPTKSSVPCCWSDATRAHPFGRSRNRSRISRLPSSSGDSGERHCQCTDFDRCPRCWRIGWKRRWLGVAAGLTQVWSARVCAYSANCRGPARRTCFSRPICMRATSCGQNGSPGSSSIRSLSLAILLTMRRNICSIVAPGCSAISKARSGGSRISCTSITSASDCGPLLAQPSRRAANHRTQARRLSLESSPLEAPQSWPPPSWVRPGGSAARLAPYAGRRESKRESRSSIHRLAELLPILHLRQVVVVQQDGL